MEGTNMENMAAEKLNVLLDWVGETTKSAQGFMLEQAPLVAQEIVAWEFWSSVLAATMFAVGAAMFSKGIQMLWRKDEQGRWAVSDDVARAMPTAFGAMAIVGFVVGVAFHTAWAVKAQVAPRLVIIEYIGKAVK